MTVNLGDEDVGKLYRLRGYGLCRYQGIRRGRHQFWLADNGPVRLQRSKIDIEEEVDEIAYEDPTVAARELLKALIEMTDAYAAILDGEYGCDADEIDDNVYVKPAREVIRKATEGYK